VNDLNSPCDSAADPARLSDSGDCQKTTWHQGKSLTNPASSERERVLKKPLDQLLAIATTHTRSESIAICNQLVFNSF